MITSKSQKIVQLLNNVLDETVKACFMNNENLDVSINNLLQALDLSYDYETKIIDNDCFGSDVKSVEKPGAIKLSDWLIKK